MSRLTYKSESGMTWFVDEEGRKLEPCEMSPHHSRLAIEKLAHYEDLEEAGRLIDRKALETTLSSTMRALTIIGEICVEESKMHIDKKMAVREIRECLRKYNPVSSRYELELLLDELAERVSIGLKGE